MASHQRSKGHMYEHVTLALCRLGCGVEHSHARSIWCGENSHAQCSSWVGLSGKQTALGVL